MSAYPDLSLFIGNTWRGTSGRDTQEVLNPATGQCLGRLPLATAGDLDDALCAAHNALAGWRSTPAAERGGILRGAAALLRQRAESLACTLSLELGKPLSESLAEVLACAETFEWCADEGRRIYGRIVPARQGGWRQLVLKEPVGVVAAFAPWNFPGMIPARKIASSLAAGCTCIIKPAEETPATSLELARALQDSGLPAGVLNVVYGVPAQVSETLIASPFVRKVSFTGSVLVGRRIAALAAAHAKPATLELGGHAPVLVFDDANIEAAARACAAGKFRNSGQVCTSPTRFFVQRGIHDQFLKCFMDATAALRVGSFDEGSTMGPVASERRLHALESLVRDAVDRGATVAAGGGRRDCPGFFFEPTILHGDLSHARAMREEPFGPLALVQPFDTEHEAIALANALPFGLAAYAFTRDADRTGRLAEQIEAGMLGINTCIIAGADTPFGGVKDSGYGSEGGPEGIEAYLATKYVAQAPAG